MTFSREVGEHFTIRSWKSPVLVARPSVLHFPERSRGRLLPATWRSVTSVSGCVESLVILGLCMGVVAGLRTACKAPADWLPRPEIAPKDLLPWTLFLLCHIKNVQSEQSLTLCTLNPCCCCFTVVPFLYPLCNLFNANVFLLMSV